MRLHRAEDEPGKTSRIVRRVLLAVGVVAVLGVLMPAPAGAHPLGNFTVNTSAALRIRPDEVLVDYVIDQAEIPTVQARTEIDADGDGDLSGPERDSYASSTCAETAAAIDLVVGDRAVTLHSTEAELTFPPGEAGLDTLRLRCRLIGDGFTIDGPATVRLDDQNFDGRLGWREIVALGDRTTITSSDVGSTSTSERLTAYPEDQIESPLDERSATIEVEPGGSPVADPDGGDSGGSASPLPGGDRLQDLLGERNLTLPFALFAVGVAFVLGGFHAVAPGHGKTVMAAYLVGQHGARRQAFLLGATVAFTHTGGVMALALVVSNSSIAPERFYPILGSLSGVLVIVIGAVLLRRAVQFRRIFPTLEPGAGHHHHHGIGGHTHTHDAPPVHADQGHDHDDPVTVAAESGTTVTATRPVDDHAGHDYGEHDHSHTGRDHDEHDHAGHEHAHEHALTPIAAAPPIELRSMMAMGFAGGMVPSPSALVVLLGSIAIGRAWFGFVLIIAYGAGLAAVLVGAGLLIERLRHRIEPLLARRRGSRLGKLAVNLPIITAVLVVLGGGYLIARALVAA